MEDAETDCAVCCLFGYWERACMNLQRVEAVEQLNILLAALKYFHSDRPERIDMSYITK